MGKNLARHNTKLWKTQMGKYQKNKIFCTLNRTLMLTAERKFTILKDIGSGTLQYHS